MVSLAVYQKSNRYPTRVISILIGVLSAWVTLSAGVPLPAISSINPPSARPGSAFTITIVGANFEPGAVVNFGTATISPSVATPQSLMLTVPAELAFTGTPAVTVTNPGSAKSNEMLFPVSPPQSSLSFRAAPYLTPASNPVSLAALGLGEHPSLAILDGKASNRIVSLSSDELGEMVLRGSASIGRESSGMIAGDFGNDGLPDLAVISRCTTIACDLNIAQGSILIFRRNSEETGGFTHVGTQVTQSQPVSITTGDFNRDGTLDLAVSTVRGTVELFWGTGDGLSFIPGPTLAMPSMGSAGAIVAGDFNGDGILDLAVASRASGSVVIWQGDGQGSFSGAEKSLAAKSPGTLLVADFNNDGILDIAVANAEDPTIGIFLGNNDGTFQRLDPPATFSDLPIAAVNTLIAADFDADGTADLLVAASGGVFLLAGDGTGHFSSAQALPGSGSPLIALSLLNSGRLDLVGAGATLKQVPNLISASRVAFGEVPSGGTSAQTVFLQNTTESPLRITGNGISGRNGSDFTQIGGNCTIGTVLQPGERCHSDVMFSPVAAGDRTAELTFSDDKGDKPLAVVLSGQGMQNARGTEITAASIAAATGTTYASLSAGTDRPDRYRRAGAASVQNTFTEFFDSTSPTSQWAISSGGTSGWWSSGQTPGMHTITDAAFSATAPWAVGNAQFNLSFDVFPNNIYFKTSQPNVYGFVIGLTTGVPGSMGTTGASIVANIGLDGVCMGMRSGELAGLGGYDLSGFCSGGTTFQWPQGSTNASIPTNWKWTFKFSRDSANNLTLAVYVDQYQGGAVPFWTGTYAIPAGYQNKSFQYVCIQNLTTSTASPYQVSAQISNIYGWTALTGGSAYTVTNTVPSGGSTTYQSGNTITINGTGFDSSSSYTLRVGSGPSLQMTSATYVSSTALTTTLPAEPNGATYAAFLYRNGMYVPILGGITYGVGTLYSISPHEVPPVPQNPSDGTVNVTACGVDPTSTMTFAGNTAAVTYIDPCHLSVIVPAGTAGKPRIVLMAASNSKTLYDSNNSSTYPPSGKVNFGYAPHPYLNFSTSGTSGVPTLASIQAQWNNPVFTQYVSVLEANLAGTTTTDTVCSPLPCWALPAGSPGAGSFLDYGWAYILSGNSSYLSSYNSALASTFSGNGSSAVTLNPASPILNSIVFNMSGFAFGLSWAQQIAQFYDALFPNLTPSQRASYLVYLDNALSAFNYQRATVDFNCGNAASVNRQAVCAAGGGEVALALYNSVSTVKGYTAAAPAIAITAGALVNDAIALLKTQNANPYLRSWQSDGGNVEGPQYAGFGGTPYLAFGHAYYNAAQLLGLTNPSQMFTSANIEQLNNWVNSLWDGTTWVSYDDTQPQFYDVALLAEVGSRQGLPALTYLADYLVSQSFSQMYSGALGFQTMRYDYLPYAFLWRGTGAGVVPAWPVVQVNSGVDQAALRSTSNFATELYVGIKGKSQQESIGGGHTHPDQGSFVIQSAGEEFLIDPGYYVSGATNHSLLSVDGTVPSSSVSNAATTFDSTATLSNANFRCATVVPTASYGSAVSIFRRNFCLYNNGSNRMAFVLDDVQPTGPGRIVSYFQSGKPVTLTSGSGFQLTGQYSNLSVAHNGPSFTETSAAGNLNCGTSTPAWIFCLEGTKYNIIQLAYTATAGTPMITTFAPSGSAMTASIDRSTANQITLTLSDGATATFNLISGYWNLTGTTP